MRIWKQDISLAALQATGANTAVSHLGIEFTEVGDDYLVARVPVNRQTCQPYGLLHGGVSVVLAETLGSCGAAFSVPLGTRVVGLEVNANHLRGVQEGWMQGRCKPGARQMKCRCKAPFGSDRCVFFCVHSPTCPTPRQTLWTSLPFCPSF